MIERNGHYYVEPLWFDMWRYNCPACYGEGTIVVGRDNPMPTYCPSCGETADYDKIQHEQG